MSQQSADNVSPEIKSSFLLDRVHGLEEFRAEAKIRLKNLEEDGEELKNEIKQFKEAMVVKLGCLDKRIVKIDKTLYAATAVLMVFQLALKYDLFKILIRG